MRFQKSWRVLLPVLLALVGTAVGVSVAAAGELDDDPMNNSMHLLTRMTCAAGVPWVSWTATAPASAPSLQAGWYHLDADPGLRRFIAVEVERNETSAAGLFQVDAPVGHTVLMFLDAVDADGNQVGPTMGRNMDHVPDCQGGSADGHELDACADGYVWREAVSGDHVCVEYAVREQALADNAERDNRVQADGAYGPDTCIDGYVWREATTPTPYADGSGRMVFNPYATSTADHVCVTPDVRAATATDNVWDVLTGRLR